MRSAAVAGGHRFDQRRAFIGFAELTGEAREVVAGDVVGVVRCLVEAVDQIAEECEVDFATIEFGDFGIGGDGGGACARVRGRPNELRSPRRRFRSNEGDKRRALPPRASSGDMSCDRGVRLG